MARQSKVSENHAELDRRLLKAIQQGMPLLQEPFAELASQLGYDEGQLLDCLRSLKQPDGIIREISAIFDASAMGYDQALVAFKVAQKNIAKAGTTVAKHPGVSHCYHREGPEEACNLWFTLAISPASRLGLEKTTHVLADNCEVSSSAIFRALKCYKLDTRFTTVAPTQVNKPPTDAPQQPSEEHLRAIHALQEDLPIRKNPFAPLAEAAGMDVDTLLDHAKDFLSWGWMRRYAAQLYHRRAGAAANVMVAWRVPPAAADTAARKCAQLAQVSHCFLRQSGPQWHYSLYTMIHGHTRQDCSVAIDEIIAIAGIADRVELWTAEEYKKQRIQLFSDEEVAWETKVLEKI